MPRIGSVWTAIAITGLTIRVVVCMNTSSTFTLRISLGEYSCQVMSVNSERMQDVGQER